MFSRFSQKKALEFFKQASYFDTCCIQIGRLSDWTEMRRCMENEAETKRQAHAPYTWLCNTGKRMNQKEL